MAGIANIAQAANVTVEQVKAVVDAIKACKDPVIIKDFGTFKAVTRAARTGRNPQTGETMLIPAKTVLSFKATKPKK